MSNIIDSIQLSGVTYTLSAETSGGGITSGEVQTMIDQSISGKQDTLIAGTNITIDSANIISTSGLVTVEGNEVEPYSVEIANIYEEADITLNLSGYSNCADIMQFYWYGTSEDQTNNLTITNESGETKNGYWWWDSYNNNKVVLSTGLTEDGNATLDEYVITTGETPQTHTCYLKVSTHNGWRIKSASSYNRTGYDKGVRMILYQDKFEGGQSSYVIENVIEPELVRLDDSLSAKTDTSAFTAYSASVETALSGKQDVLSAGTGISISGNVISATGGGGNQTVELTQAEYDALVSAGTVSADTYYIITDAQAGDLTQYWTSAQTQSAINQATSGKADSSSLATVATSGDYNDLTNKPTIPTVPTSNTAFTNDAGYATSGYVDSVVSGKVNISDNNVSAFSGVPLAINVNEGYGSLQLKTIYIKNNDVTQHTNVVFGEIKYSNGSNILSTNISGSSVSTSGITAITNTDTTAHTFTLENGVCRIDFLGSCYFSQIGSEGDGFSFYYIHNNNYTSGQSSTVIENTVYDALTELGKDIVDMNDSGRFVNVSKAQDITGNKTFIGSANTSQKPIIFKQANNNHKIGFSCQNPASTNNEIATFEFRPNTYTDGGGVQHPLLYLGHYRTNNIANAGVVQTMVGFRQYDQSGAAAYHYLMPLPADAKTPFSLTTSFKNYFAPLGFKNGDTMITTDNTGVADFSSVLGGLKLVKLTQSEYDALSPNYDSNTLYIIKD